MSISRLWMIYICIYLSAILLVACMPIYPNYQLDPIAELERDYGVSEAAVKVVADSYGISIDELAAFGPEPFPINYVLHQLKWEIASTHNPTVYRSKVEALISGYSAICKTSETSVLYLFYGGTDKLLEVPKSSIFGKPGPLVLRIGYRYSPAVKNDQVVEYIMYMDTIDDGPWEWSEMTDLCIPVEQIK